MPFSMNQVSVALQGEKGVSGRDVKRKTCQALGLKQSSHELFSLFICNSYDKILQKIKDTDYITTPVPGLVLRKWSFNQKQENEVIRHDGVACHLVYSQAEDDIGLGRLLPNKHQEQQLEEYSDPDFTVEQQYIKVCQDIKGYFSIRVLSCGMCHGPTNTLDRHNSTSEHSVSIVLCVDGVEVDTGQSIVNIPLYCVQSWSINSVASVIQYRYKNSADHDMTLSLKTDQFQYLHAGTVEAVTEFQVRHPNASSFFASMISTSPDSTVTVWENAVFDDSKASRTCGIEIILPST